MSKNSKSTVVGNLEIIENFYMPELNRFRTIRVWTPSNYNTSNKYPVIYMHDGQNLFDDYTSFAGEWGVDESIENLIINSKTKGFIVVGIDNSEFRMSEYTPNWGDIESAEGDKYAKFIVNTLKPYIDSNYNTLKDRNNTIIMGSSMGGLISFYTGLNYQKTFGYIGSLSTSFQINSVEARNKFINSLDYSNPPFLYLDAGTLEHSMNYINDVKTSLINAGQNKDKIYSLIKDKHAHNEGAWRIRFKDILLLLIEKMGEQ